jgi:hypothetical protein
VAGSSEWFSNMVLNIWVPKILKNVMTCRATISFLGSIPGCRLYSKHIVRGGIHSSHYPTYLLSLERLTFFLLSCFGEGKITQAKTLKFLEDDFQESVEYINKF